MYEHIFCIVSLFIWVFLYENNKALSFAKSILHSKRDLISLGTRFDKDPAILKIVYLTFTSCNSKLFRISSKKLFSSYLKISKLHKQSSGIQTQEINWSLLWNPQENKNNAKIKRYCYNLLWCNKTDTLS